MYAGTTFRKKSGHIAGVHQRIDRIARRNLAKLMPDDAKFPSIADILHFEGNNGPDGIKRKSPSTDEPWHLIDPSNPEDVELYHIINDHIYNLRQALDGENMTRSAFEAAWLAHAIVDGLTPAHHYPLGEKIEELWGAPREDRLTIKQKNIVPGNSRRDTLVKNWEYWGAKGIFTTHVLFELGVALAIRGHRFRSSLPTTRDLRRLEREGFEVLMRETVEAIYRLRLYEQFWKKGWSTRLALSTRRDLVPQIIRMVTLAWYDACKR